LLSGRLRCDRMRRSMRRREFITLIGGAAATWPLAARGQQLRRIGVLETTAPALNAANMASFRQGKRERGDQENPDVRIEYRSADGQTARFPALAVELVRQRVDLILTRGTPAVLAAKNATTTIPIVMAAIGEAFEVVSSLARPGGNVTGLSAFV